MIEKHMLFHGQILKYSHVLFLTTPTQWSIITTHNVWKVFNGLKYKNVGRNLLKTFILPLFKGENQEEFIA